MEDFPKLIDRQVALLRANKDTGTVLDENFEFAIANEQKVFTVFNTFEEAAILAESITKERKDVEVIIYDNEKNDLLYLE